VARVARDLGVLLEINAQPDRLDLNDVHVKMAREAGARFVISTDAHRVAELDFMRYGVDQARRGWCAAEDVANTRSLSELRRLLEKRPALPPPVRVTNPSVGKRHAAVRRGRRSSGTPAAGPLRDADRGRARIASLAER
jgi:DNA polymerase (family X)